MTLKIERLLAKHGMQIRLSGELRGAQLPEVLTEIERDEQAVFLDLEEVNLVDVHAVRFLNACEDRKIGLINCALYVREWMLQERAAPPEVE